MTAGNKIQVAARVRLWSSGWRYGLVIWNWRYDDLFCIKLDGERIDEAKTYKVTDDCWRINVQNVVSYMLFLYCTVLL